MFVKKENRAVLTITPGDTCAYARLIGSNDSLDSISTIILDGSKLEIEAPVTFKSISLKNHSILSHPVTTCNYASALNITVIDTLFVDSTSSIDVSGKGYPGSQIDYYGSYHPIFWSKDNTEISDNCSAVESHLISS
jgi:hypothetical protein